jgi:hypothetical protein
MALQVFQVDNIEGRLVRRAQNNTWRDPRLERLAPARGAQAPAVAGLKSRKAEVGLWRGEIVAPRFGEFEEVGGDLDAYRMQSKIFRPGMAAAGAVEARQRSVGAALQRLSEDVLLTLERIGVPLQHLLSVPEPSRDGKMHRILALRIPHGQRNAKDPAVFHDLKLRLRQDWDARTGFSTGRGRQRAWGQLLVLQKEFHIARL